MILTLWTALTSRLAGYLAAVGLAASILFAAYSKGKSDAAVNQTKDRLDTSIRAKEVENEVDSLGGGDVDGRFNRWVRDN